MKLLKAYKPKGMTPLQVIETIRVNMPELKSKKISYAGRLDPLAHGVLLLVIDDEIKQKDRYLSLPKTYEFEVLFGFTTDTYDILGYLQEVTIKPIPKNVNKFVNTFVKNSIGNKIQSYPPYSSKTVMGKPLFWWARNGKLNKITIPTHTIEIFQFKILGTKKISVEQLEEKIKNEIMLVKGDFRQEMILERWEQFFSSIKNPEQTFVTIKFHIDCSSGTYIRELAKEMGEKIGCGAIAIDILRTKVGNYSFETKELVRLHDNLVEGF